MENLIVIVALMMCGKVDTYVINYPDKQIVVHEPQKNVDTLIEIQKTFKGNDVIMIKHTDKRLKCI